METEFNVNSNLNEIKICSCWACGAKTDAGDNYCRKCGKGQNAFVTWYYKHWGIIMMIIGFGPFALYFVWRSPVLSRNAKWAYTAVLSILAVLVAVVVYNLFMVIMPVFKIMTGSVPLPY